MVEGVRLQKVLAAASAGSRRFCEELIATGCVELNGEVVTRQGVRVNPGVDEVRVNGQKINMNPNTIAVALHKPKGVVSAMFDDRNRLTITDLVGNRYGRLFHIGRLDQDSSGLILLTNDGDLAEIIAHPRFEIAKTYILKLQGRLTPGVIQKTLKGFELEDGFMKFDRLRVLGETGNNPTKVTLVEVVIHSGKNRILRRSFEHFNLKVLELVRTQIGNIRLEQLPKGKTRVLAHAEVAKLEAIALNKMSEVKNSRRNSRSNLKVHKLRPSGL